MGLTTSGVHHLTLRVSALERSRAFYSGVLGLVPDQDWPDKLRDRLGSGTRLVLRPPLPGAEPGGRFSEQRVGPNHVSLAVANR